LISWIFVWFSERPFSSVHFISLFIAYIPTPIVLAQVIDQCCILWNNQCPNEKGTCLEYSSDSFHFIIFGSSGAVKIVSCIVLLVFSAYVHKNYILKRKYQNQVTLRHDQSSILSSRQKYMIDNHVASSDGTSDLNASCGVFASSDNMERSSTLRATTRYRKMLERMRLRKREGSIASASTDDSISVVLKSHHILDDSYSSVGSRPRVNSPELFTDLAQLRSEANTPASLADEPSNAKEAVALSIIGKSNYSNPNPDLKYRKSTSHV
jgi:hypothetical protein